MKKIVTIVLSLALVLALSFALIGCNQREYTPDRQGSKVMTIDYKTMNGYVTSAFDTYGEFCGSEYANMCLNGVDIPAKDSFYTRPYFLRHKLMVARFNDDNNIQHFVSSIKKDGDTYTATILRFVDTTITRPSRKSYALFLEIPGIKKVKNMTLKLDIQPRQELPNIVTGTSLIATSNEPAIAALIKTYDELTAYSSKVDQKTRDKLERYDNTFFLTHNLLTVDFMAYSNTITTYDYDNADHLLTLNAYNSDHYVSPSTRPRRIVKYVPIAKGTIIDKIVLNTYWESDIDSTHVDTCEEIAYTNR